MGALERIDQLRIIVVASAQPGTLELERKPRQRVREHIVHLARDAAARRARRRRPGVARIFELAQQALGLLLALGEPAGESRNDEGRGTPSACSSAP